MHCGASPKHLPISLFLIRASVVLMLAPWVADKFINPAHMVGIAESFYGITGRGATLVLIFGVAQMVLLVCFALGIARTWSYGPTLLMHGSPPSLVLEAVPRPLYRCKPAVLRRLADARRAGRAVPATRTRLAAQRAEKGHRLDASLDMAPCGPPGSSARQAAAAG